MHEHRFGLCSRAGNSAIIWIPKNASSSLRALGLKEDNFTSFKVEEYWAILRDPFSRWKSGVVEYIKRNLDKTEYVLNNLHNIEFDEHTTPQCDFLPIGEKINFVKKNAEGLQKLCRNLNLPPLRNVNKSIIDFNKIPIYTKLEKRITPNIHKLVKEYYSRDYYLLHQNSLIS